ncbi:hypothetical protein ACLOJK_025219, partial [Asimina triloba]
MRRRAGKERKEANSPYSGGRTRDYRIVYVRSIVFQWNFFALLRLIPDENNTKPDEKAVEGVQIKSAGGRMTRRPSKTLFYIHGSDFFVDDKTAC